VPEIQAAGSPQDSQDPGFHKLAQAGCLWHLPPLIRNSPGRAKTMKSLALIALATTTLLLTGARCAIRDGQPTGFAASSCSEANDRVSAGADVGVLDLTRAAPGELAQSFLNRTEAAITGVSLRLRALRSPGSTLGGKLRLSIQGDSGGFPDGDPVGGEEAELLVAAIPSTGEEYQRFNFSRVLTLLPDRRYFIVVDATYSPSATDHVRWLGADGDPYPRGAAFVRNPVLRTWGEPVIGAARDLAFRLECSQP
jgi:hypothetical protein